jgi:hypothetical protein
MPAQIGPQQCVKISMAHQLSGVMGKSLLAEARNQCSELEGTSICCKAEHLLA